MLWLKNIHYLNFEMLVVANKELNMADKFCLTDVNSFVKMKNI